uniref:Movement protein n=1 Tax=Milk vetch chlorotic dwarf virus TaxID=2683340 RepID=A0A650FYU7_9VIRU|nr:movement protein [Milk vetch chlorotic dwarf virus]
MGDQGQGYYSGYQPDDEGQSTNNHQVLNIIGIVLLIILCISGIWVCIMLACYIPGFVKKTLDAWLSSSSIMKRRLAATITRTPYEETGPERERRWSARRNQTEGGVQGNNNGSGFS